MHALILSKRVSRVMMERLTMDQGAKLLKKKKNAQNTNKTR